LTQAAEIARTEAEVPGSEAELLALARQSGLAAVKDQARKARLAAADPEALRVRQRAARRPRHWRAELGMVCFTGALTPEVGLLLVNRLDAQVDRLYRQARRAGRDERRDALAADALAAMLAGAGANPVANGGPTCYDNLKPRCWPHHRDKTEQDRKAGLLGGEPP
jgi:hypothetical protein